MHSSRHTYKMPLDYGPGEVRLHKQIHRIPFITVSIYDALIQIQIGYRYGDLGYNISFLEI